MLITNTEFADHVMLVHSANSQIEKKIDIYPSDANTHSRNIKLYDNLLPYDIRQGSVCSVKSLGRLGHWGDMRDDSAEILFQSFLQEALVSSSGMGKGCPFFDGVHPAFPLPTTASPFL